MLLLLISLSAQAGTIDLWSVDNFGSNGELAGTNGWKNGYSRDTWYAYEGGAYTLTDENTGDNGGFSVYGEDTAADNWIVRADSFDDGLTAITFYNQDDDSFGLVSHLSDSQHFYILLLTAGSTPPPMTGGGTLVALIKVDGDGGTLLQQGTARGWSADQELSLELQVNDGVLTALYEGDEVFSVTDKSPLPAGLTGLFAYDTGARQNVDNSYAWSTGIVVKQYDDDDDSVADDSDNCEFVANKDQADADNDKIGDACDEPAGGDDTATDDSAATDDSTPVDDSGTIDSIPGPGDSGAPFGEGGLDRPIKLGSNCACSAQSMPSGAYLPLLGMLLMLRRRSR